MTRWVPCGVLAGAAALLCACATTPQLDRLRAGPISLPSRVELSDVPFFPQERYQCGPAALSTVLSWGGLGVRPEDLVSQVYLPERRGSIQVEMLGAVRRHRWVPYVLRPRLEDMLTEVAAGHPVVVLQNLGLGWAPAWHYAVLIGYDLERAHVVLRSGLERRRVTSLPVFARTWGRSRRWAFVALPPDQLPATAREAPFVEAAAALERLGHWPAARSAYAAALERWPDSLAAGIGLGNALVALDDLAGAESAFRSVVESHPSAPEAHNNLADVLARLGRLSEAERAARRAVALDGPHAETARRTLSEIRALRSKRGD
ncbi:MAG: PA2778 family cysteine peptidase [Gammaproteobacteria bacterium]|nr:PA2778 family cysteine peptidase [Gammaproteobacteria bacterium]NIR96795.1 PA2778 family cysteine peptidase [Gammaproteobacteria bacterium]NIT62495.1 PA2778 family cysteine peptidase [Gammaproteobacteria bacterium]NIV19435.1 PA2778 family cysteine peptidase [Gammaproteobacteria bacterium]NIX10518.1 PA2778 family cysteine peptidase [Gammaproteobacteria bacterium]